MFTSRCPRLRAGCFALLALLALPVLPLFAAEVQNLYSAEVPAPESAGAATDAALGAALREVLVKVTGQRDPERNPELQAAVERPGPLVRSYGIVSRPDPAGGPPQAMLSANFDPVQIDALLRSAGVPVWGRVRPGVLAWVVVQSADGRALVGAEDAPEALTMLRAAAARRAIPLDVPLMDLEDRARISADQVWRAELDALRAASARYGSEVVLAASAEQVLPTLWEVAWTLMLGDDVRQWRTRGDVLELALDDGVNEAADIIAERYVAGVGTSEGFNIRVSGVNTLQDYARTLHYLESLEPVASLALERAELDTLTFRLRARGDAASLRRVIGLGDTLMSIGEPGSDSFRLRP